MPKQLFLELPSFGKLLGRGGDSRGCAADLGSRVHEFEFLQGTLLLSFISILFFIKRLSFNMSLQEVRTSVMVKVKPEKPTPAYVAQGEICSIKQEV